ncbi:hypothetical protein [Methylocapsa sp. S129]|uniref:hypothetical protein n=1 Tax=Methylocapsa sp. S129 TaxID=1641869 RepID=UPI00131C1D7B|nr:hypothetical protein [Methylocapsa sp. S129]
MLWAEDDVRKLVEKLTASSRGGSGANLTPEDVDIAVAALRAYCDKLLSPPATGAIVSFQIEALDGVGLPREALATTVDPRVARSAFARAKRRFPDQKIVLRGQTISGERVHPDDASSRWEYQTQH